MTKISWDAVLVAFGMVIGFIIVVMKITDYWPCDILNNLHIGTVSCDNSIQQNLSSIANLFHQNWIFANPLHYLLQFLHNI